VLLSAPLPDPRIAYVPSADGRSGEAAIALAALAGITLDGWQKMTLVAGCDRRGGKWSAFEVGIVVPRQNGKSVVLAVRELAGLLLFGERLVIHSAHEWRTVSEQFQATLELVESTPLSRYLRRVRRAGGEEQIVFTNGSRLRFMNRSKESARGFSADLVVLDEAHALSEEQAGALLPVLSARPDAQIWYAAAGPAPTAWHLARIRNRAMSDDPGKLAWLEWSADPLDDLADPAVWAAANPAVAAGRLSLERMAEERAALGAHAFAAERLAAASWPSEMAGAWTVFTEEDYLAMVASGRPAA
jgi:phage terminase large subunit-like protein